MCDMNLVVYQGDNEWSALYVDGKLHKVGDHYLVDEAIRSLLEIKTIYSNDFMRGGSSASGVAQTLDEAESYGVEREEDERVLDSLEQQAKELSQRIKELRKSRG